MATKFGTKSAITRLTWEISRRFLRITGGFLGRAIEWRQTNSTTTKTLPWQRNLKHYRLKLGLCKRYPWDLCVKQGVIGDGLLNDARKILPRPTLVAMETKFGTKSALTRLVQEISLRACVYHGVIEVGLSNDVKNLFQGCAVAQALC